MEAMLEQLEAEPVQLKSMLATLAVDASSALTAGMVVAPAVSIIDRAVTESVSGRATMMNSVKTSLRTLLLRPHQYIFARPFAIMLVLYSSTYLSANLVDTATSRQKKLPAETTTAGVPKFLATSAVNLNLSLFKDTQYAKMFGVTAPTAFPPLSLGIYMVRDCMTLFASFNLPSRIAPLLPTSWDSHVSRSTITQLSLPMAMQVFATPLHLLGLDLYNRNHRTPISDRWAAVKRAWPRTAVARMCRVLPAFGIGGVVNTKVRINLMRRI
ncbi:hypothetical protein KVT40_007567 [Elsinoe batatas]|uniref:Sequence orphan n=1 Tax=Elsinoe batatas TaxID=2601811 RepID=A0A8K0KWD0_9PEZI|nr:hypothetical protein KVT40_007567 [Elsinoe batatas]